MEGNPEQQRGSRPEDGERLQINGIILPVDNGHAIREDLLGASHLLEYQRIVGPNMEHIALERPPSSMLVNEELSNPINRRATLLAWMHNSAFRYTDVVHGDALVVGPPDRLCRDTDAPDELLQVLFQANRFRVEVQVAGEPGWRGNIRRFNDWVEAYAYVLNLGLSWTRVQDVRVVPET
jgi:hypothetical protein